MDRSIHSTIINCLGHLNELIASRLSESQEWEVARSLWQDELGRLRIWAENIGVHQIDEFSLEYRLRDASHIKDQVTRVLAGIQDLLCDLEELLSDESSGTKGVVDDDSDNFSEMQQIYNSLVEFITCLHQISIVVRRPSPHDRISGTVQQDSIPFLHSDRSYVLNKFPGANIAIIDRLGDAISTRRAIFKYYERRHLRFSQDTKTAHDRHSEVGSPSLSDRFVAEFKQRLSLHGGETSSEDDSLQTNLADILYQAEERTNLPPPPEATIEKSHLRCPYCYYAVTLKNKSSWARHIIADIQPYICIFLECPTPGRLYTNRLEWFDHLENEHLVSRKYGAGARCPLCRDELQSPQPEKHLALHLLELALFSLPRVQSEGNAESSSQTELSDNIGIFKSDIVNIRTDGLTDPKSAQLNRQDEAAEESHPEGYVERAELSNIKIETVDPGQHTIKEPTRLWEIDPRPQAKGKDELGRAGRDLKDKQMSTEKQLSKRSLREFFLPGYGISSELIQENICGYLGDDAELRPGEDNGLDGYIYRAQQPLTLVREQIVQLSWNRLTKGHNQQMIAELKERTAKMYSGTEAGTWQAEKSASLLAEDANPVTEPVSHPMSPQSPIQHDDNAVSVPITQQSTTQRESTASDVSQTSQGKRRNPKTHYYYCCQCNNGPNISNHEVRCLICDHSVCSFCIKT